MRRLCINTANKFEDDYFESNFKFEENNWTKTDLSLENILGKFSSHKFDKNKSNLLNLRNREKKLIIFLEDNINIQNQIFSATLTGLKSNERVDFTNRVIRDGINFTQINKNELSIYKEEIINISINLFEHFFDKNFNFDKFSSIEKFNSDQFSFVNLELIWSSFIEEKKLSKNQYEFRFFESVRELLKNYSLKEDKEKIHNNSNPKIKRKNFDLFEQFIKQKFKVPDTFEEILSEKRVSDINSKISNLGNNLFSKFNRNRNTSSNNISFKNPKEEPSKYSIPFYKLENINVNNFLHDLLSNFPNKSYSKICLMLDKDILQIVLIK